MIEFFRIRVQVRVRSPGKKLGAFLTNCPVSRAVASRGPGGAPPPLAEFSPPPEKIAILSIKPKKLYFDTIFFCWSSARCGSTNSITGGAIYFSPIENIILISFANSINCWCFGREQLLKPPSHWTFWIGIRSCFKNCLSNLQLAFFACAFCSRSSIIT